MWDFQNLFPFHLLIGPKEKDFFVLILMIFAVKSNLLISHVSTVKCVEKKQIVDSWVNTS